MTVELKCILVLTLGLTIQMSFCAVGYTLYCTVLPQTRYPIVTIISSNLTDFHNPFTAGKFNKFQTKNIAHDTYNVLPHSLEKLKCSNLFHFCILRFNKSDSNIITS